MNILKRLKKLIINSSCCNSQTTTTIICRDYGCMVCNKLVRACSMEGFHNIQLECPRCVQPMIVKNEHLLTPNPNLLID